MPPPTIVTSLFMPGIVCAVKPTHPARGQRSGKLTAALHEADQAMSKEKSRYYEEAKIERRRS